MYLNSCEKRRDLGHRFGTALIGTTQILPVPADFPIIGINTTTYIRIKTLTPMVPLILPPRARETKKYNISIIYEHARDYKVYTHVKNTSRRGLVFLKPVPRYQGV